MSGNYHCHHHHSQCVTTSEPRRGRRALAATDIAAALISVPLLVVLALLLRGDVKRVSWHGDATAADSQGDPGNDPRWRVLGLGLALLTLSLLVCCYVTHRLGLCCRSRRMLESLGGRGRRRRRRCTRGERERCRNVVGEIGGQNVTPGGPQGLGAPFAVCVETRVCGSTSSQLTLVSSSADRPPPPSYDSVIKADAPPPPYSSVAWMMPHNLGKDKSEQNTDEIPAVHTTDLPTQPP
ncbi:hypothetical protein J437_LFUL001355 [Ladona fulva]|uniref:Uncharacterized protein n=1 Tax=Ladona fulva TaxID=123851 RepID=A0A8K0JZA2_LADFU|nr:hypothetical protein J437_LFUL001355 [Ladona fulva]